MVGYFPKNLKEALCMKQTNKDLIPYAGGSDLMVVKKEEHEFLFLNQISELKSSNESGEEIFLGAGVTYAELLEIPFVPDILKKAIRQIAAPAIRNVGTMGGNICNASPAGDTLPVLYALGASVKLVSLESVSVESTTESSDCSSRIIPIEEFILGIRKTDKKDTELVEGILIPKKSYTHTYYEKVGARKAQAISKLSFAGVCNIEDGRIQDIRIAFGSVGVTVIRRKELEETYCGLDMKELISKIPNIISDYETYVKPIDDQRSTAVYRKKVCMNLLEDFLKSLNHK